MTCDRVCFTPTDRCPVYPYCQTGDNLPPEDPAQGALFEEGT